MTGRHRVRGSQPDVWDQLSDQVAVDVAAFIAAGWDVGDIVALVLDVRMTRIEAALSDGFRAGLVRDV